MKILKLPWLGHRADNKNCECYSVSINADGTRLASGGLDGNVKIWDTSTILDFKSVATGENKPLPDESLRRPLCSMSRHNGVVTTVKFSPDGRFLASGSDDKICLIWEKEDLQVPRTAQFGEEPDLEHWSVRRRLVAHENDIQDISWSPDGLLLVTVGLDRSIIVWNAVTFERIKRYDVHQSMVKGIVFDPANKFFATASDDRTVRIFRYYRKLNDANYEFQMEHIVVDPFKKSPLTSYFRRLSWSPDGQHIAVPNATNGPVSSVAIINRGNWTTDVSLIGHEAPSEVCAFSPRLFQANNEDGFSTIVATAGQDRSLAVWSTTMSRPLVLAQDIAAKSITDMCWAPDGTCIYLCCLDGSITVVTFDNDELGVVASEDAINAHLNKYGADRESNIFPESISQLRLEGKSNVDINRQTKTVGRTTTSEQTTQNVTSEQTISSATSEQTISSSSRQMSSTSGQIMSAMTSEPSLSGSLSNSTPKAKSKPPQITYKNGKKRVAPTLISTTAKEVVPVKEKKKVVRTSNVSQCNYHLPRLGLQTAVHGTRLRGLHKSDEPALDPDNDNDDIGNNTAAFSSTQTVSEASLRRQRNKLMRTVMEKRYPSAFKQIATLPESLFHTPQTVNYEANRLLSAHAGLATESDFSALENDEDVLFSVVFRALTHEPHKGEGIEGEKESTKHNMEEPKGDISNQPLKKRKGEYEKSNETELNKTELNEGSQANGETELKEGSQLNEESSSRKINEPEPQKLERTFVEVRNGSRWPEDEETHVENDPSNMTDFNDPTKVIVTSSRNTHTRSYTLYFPFRIQHVHGIFSGRQLRCFMLVSFHGTIQFVDAWSGNYVCPPLELGDNVVSVRHSNATVVVLTNTGLIYSWDTSQRVRAVLKGVSVAPVINADVSTDKKAVVLPEIKAFEVDETGTPYLVMDNSHDVFCYSADLACWTKVVDSWYYLAGMSTGMGFVDRLVKRTHRTFWDDVHRGLVNTYSWEGRGSRELRGVMERRMKEV